MRRFLGASVLALSLAFATAGVGIAGGKTIVYRFADEPFNLTQCYGTADFFPGPAATFEQDVCVDYVAQNSETVRFNGDDVSWSLIQIGTATVTSTADGSELYSGPFEVEEIAKDYGNDAGCVWTDDQHAWIGLCTEFFTNLDFLNYNWKIAGASVYYFNASISAPGEWCYSSKQGGATGPGC